MPARLSVVVPFYNEEQVLPAFFSELTAALSGLPYELETIAVDDGSRDGTFAWLAERATQDPTLRVLRFSRNFGHQIALIAGMDHATGDAVVTIDGDLQDPPMVIRDLVRKFEAGYDVVYAVRASRSGEPPWRAFAIRTYYGLIHRISRLEVPSDAGDFRLLSRRAADQVRAVRDPSPYLRGLAAWVGFRQDTVAYDRNPRAAGISQYGFFRLLQLAWNGITSLSHAPLGLPMVLGLAFSCGAFLMAFAAVFGKLAFGVDLPDGTTLLTVVLFLGGVQLTMLGILGEYIGRIHEDVKRRPLYVLQDKLNLS